MEYRCIPYRKSLFISADTTWLISSGSVPLDLIKYVSRFLLFVVSQNSIFKRRLFVTVSRQDIDCTDRELRTVVIILQDERAK